MPTTLRRRCGPPRGAGLAEVIVAAAVLTIGVLGAVGVLAAAARDGRRARTRHAAVALLAARTERWRATPCATAATTAGEQRTGTLVERWRVTRAGTLATLTDTAVVDGNVAPGSAGRVGVVAVAWCAQ